MSSITVREALQGLARALGPHSETAPLDAQRALAHLLGRSSAWVLAHPEARLSSPQVAQLQDWLRRLQAGEPLPYVLGEWEFYGRPFFVTPAVLIPRPETETLVDAALRVLSTRPSLRVVDVGTGSGCIALTLALERPGLTVWATDVSWDALQVARRNRARYGLQDRVPLVQASLLEPLAGPWDVVVANLPYIPSTALSHLRVARWEPRLALDGGPEGTRWLRTLLAQLSLRLQRPGGHVLLEIAPAQVTALREVVGHHLPEARVEVLSDLAGMPRVLWIRT